MNSRFLPTCDSIDIVSNLNSGDKWIQDGILIAENEGLTEGQTISQSTPLTYLILLLKFLKNVPWE